MRLVKIFGGLVIMIIVLFFLMQNTSLVDVNLIFAKFPDIPVAVVMLGSLAVGIIIGYGAAITNILSSKSELRALKNKNRHLSDELNDLRNAAIDEEIYHSEDKDE
ncbi:MAG: hypothetical protein CMF81_00360 [Candidatus Marinimicrobia bacterium]|nr:hypothetical protein [Candidatus Neomarinimicrobiota bacterium]|tara:strand:+ start:2561 stop:2878 length:318 start_codon:yes stop_codon:yes gene_type:complete